MTLSKLKAYFFLSLFFIVPLTAQNIVVNPYLQSMDTQSVKIMWEADAPGIGLLHYGLTPFDLNLSIESTTEIGSGLSRIHTADLISLNPNTKYYYKVEMPEGQESKLYHFISYRPHSDEHSTELIAISDMQRDGSHPNKFQEIIEDGMAPIIFSEVGSDLSDLEAVLIPGDLVVTGGTYSQWQNTFFNPSDSLFPYIPIFPVPGNHEYFGGGLPNFVKYFDLPNNGPSGLEDECWYTDISNVRIIGLNSNSGSADQSSQLNWLGQLLDATQNLNHIDFVFAQLHHPYKSELWTPGENPFTGMVIDSMENFTQESNKPSIHFFGHTHGYSRGQSRDHKHLWVNVATAGGAIDNWGEFPNADYEEYVKSQDEYGFVMMQVEAGADPKFTLKRFGRGDQDMIENNVLRDQLTIYKTEYIPSTPLNIFPQDGDSLSSLCLTLKASDFNGVRDTLQAAHWQIATGGDFIDSLVSSKWYQNENFYYEVNLQANDDLTDATITGLASGKTYDWRIRYRDQNLEWSNWSTPTQFYLNNDIDTLSPILLINENAENGINAWTGDIESLENAECNSVAPYNGTHNFGVGGICDNEMDNGLAYQEIDLSAYAADINTGTVSAQFGGFLRNYSGNDRPELYLEFYDGTSLIGSSNVLGSNLASWTLFQDFAAVPVNTDLCRFYLKGTRNAGSDNDSYFDDLKLFLLDTDCTPCFGTNALDADNDGFCSDLDCDDSNNTVYPGALELCDGLDNNCDGIADTGDVITWTGSANNGLWSDPQNWDQQMVPLPCQYVIISNSDAITIDGIFACKGMDAGPNCTVDLPQGSFLYMDSLNDNTVIPANIKGALFIDGRWEVK